MLSFPSETDTAKDIIDKLDSIYQRTSLAVQLSIEKKLLLLKFKEDVPLCKHFIVFDEMVLELGAAGCVLTETSKIARLLLTVPSTFDSIVTAIHTQSDDNLKLAFVKIKLLDYEVKLKSEKAETSHKVLQTGVNNSATPTKFSKKNKHKKKFNQSNQKSNFSQPHNKKKKCNNSGYNGAPCEHCGRKNHNINDCFYFKKNQSNDRERTIQTIQTIDQESEHIAFMTSVHGTVTIPHDAAEIKFILDSGATDHIVNDMSVFTSFKALDKPITISVAKMGETIAATGIGSINIATNSGVNAVLERVLYAPEATNNLLSVRCMQEVGMDVIFNKTGMVLIKMGNKTISTGKQINNLICVSFTLNKTIPCESQANNIVAQNAYKLWHKRLGHISNSKFILMKQNNLNSDNELIKSINPTQDLCETCLKGKLHL